MVGPGWKLIFQNLWLPQSSLRLWSLELRTPAVTVASPLVRMTGGPIDLHACVSAQRHPSECVTEASGQMDYWTVCCLGVLVTEEWRCERRPVLVNAPTRAAADRQTDRRTTKCEQTIYPPGSNFFGTATAHVMLTHNMLSHWR